MLLNDFLPSYPKAEALLVTMGSDLRVDLSGFLDLVKPVGLTLECMDTASLNSLEYWQKARFLGILIQTFERHLRPNEQILGAPYVLDQPLAFKLLPNCVLMLGVNAAPENSDRIAKAALN